jgi:hypothetical protein
MIEAHDLLDREATVPPPALQNCRTVLYTPGVANTPRSIAREVHVQRVQLAHVVRQSQQIAEGKDPYRIDWGDTDRHTELIIVDEADRLKVQGLEQMRDIYDRGRMGLILIGMPGIEKRLARYPQLYSRVGFVHQFSPPSPAEMRFILEHQWGQLGLTLNPNDLTRMPKPCPQSFASQAGTSDWYNGYSR